MKLLRKSFLLSVSLIFATYEAIAMEDEDPHKTGMYTSSVQKKKKKNGKDYWKYPVLLKDVPSAAQTRRAVLKNLVEDSYKYSVEHPNRRPDHQSPRATIVFCSDSRCQTSELDQTPEEDLFVVRNIGNQFTLTKGSIRYGVEHLKTPLLLFVGHSKCGAIEAKLKGDPSLHEDIKNELNTLYVGDKNQHELNQGIIMNVHHQVREAKVEFDKHIEDEKGEEAGKLIERGKLTVMGAIYDFRDDFGRGANNLIFINVNGKEVNDEVCSHEGEIDPYIFSDIRHFPDLKGSFNPVIGVGEVEEKEIKPKIIQSISIEEKKEGNDTEQDEEIDN